MDRYNRGAGSASAPSAPAAPDNPYFTEGNPTLGVLATQPGPWWFHMMTEELRAVIVAAGLTPDHTDVTQLTQAIAALISDAQRAVILDSAAFEASVADGEVVYWDSANSLFDEALADGTAKQNAVGIADVTNSKVYAFGSCPILSGLTPGSRYYLSGSVAGALTTTAPASNIVTIGIAKSASEIVVDVDQAGLSGEAPGDVKYIGKDAAPSGWLKANGAAVSRTTYAALFSAIGTTFGVGDGSTTFNLPDLRGEFVRGWDDGRGVDAGRVFGSNQSHALQAHTHGGGANYASQTAAGATGFFASNANLNTGSNSGNSATETRPRNVALLAIIKY
jgi:microcystin-dependent protein